MRNEKTSSKRRTKLIADIVTYIGLAIYFLILVLPFIIIIITSFASDYEISHSIGFVWAPKFSTEGYEVLFKNDPYAVGGVPSILRGFLNTLWMTTIPTVVGLLVSGAAAYVYAKVKVPGKNILFMIEIATMSIPLGAFGMVSYLFYSAIGWQKSILPLFIPGMFGSAGTIFFLRMYFEGINKEIVEAAKIDGVGTIGIYFRMMIPLSIPAFLAQFIFAFVGGYNDYQGIYVDVAAFHVADRFVRRFGGRLQKRAVRFCARRASSHAPAVLLRAEVLHCGNRGRRRKRIKTRRKL